MSTSASALPRLSAPAPAALGRNVARGRDAATARTCRVTRRAQSCGRDAGARRSTSPVAVRRPSAAPPATTDHPRSVSAKASQRAVASVASAAVLLAPAVPSPRAERKPEPAALRRPPARASAASAAYLALGQRRPTPAESVGGRRVRSPSKGRLNGQPTPRVTCVQGPVPKKQDDVEVPSFWGVTSLAHLNNIEPINERIRAAVQPARPAPQLEECPMHHVERELLERSWSARAASGSGPNSGTASASAVRKPDGQAVRVSRSRRGGRVVRGSRSQAMEARASPADANSQVPAATRMQRSIPSDLLAARAQLEALQSRCERDISNASSANVDIVAELLVSASSKVLLNRQEESFLIDLIQRQKFLENVAADLTAQQEEPTDEAVAEAAGLAGGVHELLLVRALTSQARELMVSCNLRLVVAMARKQHTVTGIDFKDFIFEGIKGLHKAMDKFDTSKKVKFSTYAHWWVRQSISRSIAQESRVIRLPVHVHDIISKITRAEARLVAENDGTCTLADLADATGVSIEKIQMYKKIANEPRSMESHVSNDSESQLLMDTLSHDDDPEGLHSSSALLKEKLEDEAAVEEQFVANAINELLTVLRPRERNIIRMRYGLHSSDGSVMTFSDIAEAYGLTQERIRQIEDMAMRKLRRHEGLLQQKLAPL